MGVAAALTLVVATLFSPLFDLDDLTVQGVEGGPAAIVRQATGLEGGTAMFGVRPSEVRGRVEELPWVAHADVAATWPDTVQVSVTPHRPVAVIAVGDAPPGYLATSAGRVLSFEEAGPLVSFTGGVPELTVPAATDIGSGQLRAPLAALSGLRPHTAAAIGSARLDERGNLTLVGGTGPLEGAEFAFGELERVPAKSEALEAVLAGSVELACLARVDVTVPSRVTILRREGCTMPPP